MSTGLLAMTTTCWACEAEKPQPVGRKDLTWTDRLNDNSIVWGRWEPRAYDREVR